jgi:ABC-type transport system substrate-binding protein
MKYRKYTQKSAHIILCLLLILSCKKEREVGFFYTYIQSDPARLDPFYSTDVISGRIMAKMFNGLFRIDRYGRIERDLTRHFSFDGTVLKLKLRAGVFFHSGSPLSAEDVIFSFRRIWLSENPTSPRKWVFKNIKSIKKTGRDSLTIELMKPSSTFLYLLTMANCYIISREDYVGGNGIIGTGPFKLREWKQDERLVLIKNPDYFGKKPQINGIVFKIIPEDLTARFEFLNKTIDYFEMPYLSKIKFNEGELNTIDLLELSVHYIAFNTEREPFNSKLFRRALNLAIDRRKIIESLFNKRFRHASGAVPPIVGNYRSVQRPIPYRPEKAREIISQLGLSGRRFTIFIKADHQVSLIAQMIQHYLNRTGLNISIREMEWSALKAATLKGRFDMCYLTWHADYPEAENFLFPLFFSANRGSGGNRSFYKSRRVDQLLIKAQRTTNTEKRFDIYHTVERLITDDAPWIFLWYGDKKIILSKRIRKFVPYQIYNGMKGNEITMY